jgi:hypothetical protein
VINAKFSALNFTSMKFVVAELSSQTLRGLRELCEAPKLPIRISPKFVVAKLSSQTLRGLRQVCEALNSNAKFHFYLVIHNVYDALKKSSSFRTLRKLHELCEAFNSNNTSRFHGEQFIHDFTTTLVMHQARLILPLHLQSIGGVNRLAIFGELRILLLRAFPAPKEIRQSNDPNTPSGVQLYVSVTAR